MAYLACPQTYHVSCTVDVLVYRKCGFSGICDVMTLLVANVC